jgi:hypothetical protein
MPIDSGGCPDAVVSEDVRDDFQAYAGGAHDRSTLR